jgi:hypothetical protein
MIGLVRFNKLTERFWSKQKLVPKYITTSQRCTAIYLNPYFDQWVAHIAQIHQQIVDLELQRQIDNRPLNYLILASFLTSNSVIVVFVLMVAKSEDNYESEVKLNKLTTLATKNPNCPSKIQHRLQRIIHIVMDEICLISHRSFNIRMPVKFLQHLRGYFIPGYISKCVS